MPSARDAAQALRSVGVKRRDVHKILLFAGFAIAVAALSDLRLDWWDRSDMWWGGLLVMALGVHGIWKVSA